jgi:hypothetical protein
VRKHFQQRVAIGILTNWVSVVRLGLEVELTETAPVPSIQDTSPEKALHSEGNRDIIKEKSERIAVQPTTEKTVERGALGALKKYWKKVRNVTSPCSMETHRRVPGVRHDFFRPFRIQRFDYEPFWHRREQASSILDTFERVLLPPANESSRERAARMQREVEVKVISDAIDKQIAQERGQASQRRQIKVLLFGQSESGKSTLLKRRWHHNGRWVRALMTVTNVVARVPAPLCTKRISGAVPRLAIRHLFDYRTI